MQRESTLSAPARVDRVSAPGALHVQSWLGGVITLVFLLMGYRPCPLSYRGFFA